MIKYGYVRGVIFMVIASAAGGLHAMDVPKYTWWHVLQKCRPVSTVMNRTPFVYCILRAVRNVIRARRPISWLWSQKNLSSTCVAQELCGAITHNHYFPPNQFLWGAGTSAHQVEGGCRPDICAWARWEQEHVGKQDVANIHTLSERACDHWNKFTDDIYMMKHTLGLNTYRFSIEWAKVEP